MRVYKYLVFIIGLISTMVFITEAAIPGDYEKIERNVSQLTELRNQISIEKNKWSIEKEILNEEKKILLREKSYLENELKKIKEKNVSSSNQYKDLIKKREKNTELINSLLPYIDRAREDLLEFQKKLPSSLKSEFEVYYKKLQNWNNIKISQRVQSILNIYNIIEAKENSFFLKKEIIKLDKSFEFNVLYAGLSVGFAVSDNGNIAGIKYYKEGKWHFKKDNSLANTFLRAIKIFNEENPAEWIKLPLLKGE